MTVCLSLASPKGKNVVTLSMQSISNSCRMRKEVRPYVDLESGNNLGMSRGNCSCLPRLGQCQEICPCTQRASPTQTSNTSDCPSGRRETADFLFSMKR